MIFFWSFLSPSSFKNKVCYNIARRKTVEERLDTSVLQNQQTVWCISKRKESPAIVDQPLLLDQII